MEIKELQDICEEIFTLKAEIDELDKQKTEKNKRIMELKALSVKQFEAHGLTKFDSGFGTITRKERKTVKIEDRNLFLNFLEEKGVLRDSFNVTAAKATTIYNEYFEEAKEKQDVDFIMNGIPGLSDPSTFVDISINKPRKRKA